MNEFALLAFVITPLVVVALGWGLALWAARTGQGDRTAR